MDVVLVHLGGRPPSYLRTCAKQVQAVTAAPPLVVGPLEARRLHGPKLDRFRSGERLSDMGLAGFWRYATERFFVLEEAMRAAGIERCLHIENDNLLYAPAPQAMAWLEERFGDGLALCPLTAAEDTAGVMSIGSLAALERFNAALLELVELGPRELLAHYGGEMANEMRMIHLLRTDQGLAEALPTTLKAALAEGAPAIFDPASYGQHVDGIPSAPGRPYEGDHHAVGRELIAGAVRVAWDAQQRVPSVVRTADGVTLPLANLHIHSKRLSRWVPEAAPPPIQGPPGFPRRALSGGRRLSGVAYRRVRRRVLAARSSAR
jgi:hypothetical protein